MNQHVRLKLQAFSLALLLTTGAGWSGLYGDGPLFYLGAVGAIPMILIEGVHGGGTHVQNMIGGFAFVVVNVLFYYFIFRWFLGRLFKLVRDKS